MSNKQFISNLSATYADVRKLDVKKINLKGKNILEYIKESVPTIKHSQDTRETVTEDDLWGQYIETLEDGTIIVHDDWVTNPNASNGSAWNTSITKVEDNKAYVNDTLYGNIQTEKIKYGSSSFYYCNKLASFNSDLSSLINGDAMFSTCEILSSFSCKSLASLINGGSMFSGCKNLGTFTYNLSSLTNGRQMFWRCKNLNYFTSNLSSLTDGYEMFGGCHFLSKFECDNLSSLTNGSLMFYDCTNLSTFDYDLSSLTDGSGMFNSCNKLTTFTSDLSSLTNGYQMFSHCYKLIAVNTNLNSLICGDNMFTSCTNLSTFDSDLSSLIDGVGMFFGCNKLTTFTSDLSSLTAGILMFTHCSLDAESVMYIADTIKDIATEKQLYIDGTIPYVTYDAEKLKFSAPKGFMSNGEYVYTYKSLQPHTTIISASEVGKLTLGINVSNNAATIKQQLEDFAKVATFDSWDILKTYFSNKGWTVTFQYGGSPDSIPDTYDLRNGEQIIPCPIFAKLVQVEDKDSAEYCTEDASSFYNIEWGHDVTDTTDYTQFDSLEDAMDSWNVFPKENIISTEE